MKKKFIALLLASTLALSSTSVVFADEPTGSLDSKTSHIVIEELLRIIKEFNISAIIATHNIEIANALDRKIEI